MSFYRTYPPIVNGIYEPFFLSEIAQAIERDILMTKTKQSQIISRRCVAEHGKVFTAEREVRAMCDLVLDETERIESRFLEPASGQGAFFIEILRRKLAVCCQNLFDAFDAE